MISATIDSASAIRKLQDVPRRVRAVAAEAVKASARTLLARVQETLSGEILNARSGRLRQSMIETGVVESASTISDSVASDGSVPYARIQEFGGRVNIPEIVPRNASALAFEYGGKLVFAKHAAAHVVEIPARSYLGSAADELRQDLVASIRKVVMDGVT